MTIEYRVRRVERFIVTRHDDAGAEGSVRQIGGEHDNFDVAYQVGYALARKEQEDLGLMDGDDRVVFPSVSLGDGCIAGSSKRDLGCDSLSRPNDSKEAGANLNPYFNLAHSVRSGRY